MIIYIHICKAYIPHIVPRRCKSSSNAIRSSSVRIRLQNLVSCNICNTLYSWLYTRLFFNLSKPSKWMAQADMTKLVSHIIITSKRKYNDRRFSVSKHISRFLKSKPTFTISTFSGVDLEISVTLNEWVIETYFI